LQGELRLLFGEESGARRDPPRGGWQSPATPQERTRVDATSATSAGNKGKVPDRRVLRTGKKGITKPEKGQAGARLPGSAAGREDTGGRTPCEKVWRPGDH